ncbi:copper resistance CopC family protein [Saccharothrix coeruleofusca]|uniref:Copper resistance protein C n=1 Tax=Saccharothrix coeruleofusca TaxID=33919 RepID=A0A918AHW1_9PSEU|nr:copper resistance CopC family protein [Saccharothrix coeruleofusca]GGP38016.1 copper resistance protein C [Saccharothrix coeruleofusca]
MSRVVSLLLSCLVALTAAVLTAPAALAHNVLISSDPKDGAALETGPQSITLTFDQPVNAGERFNTISVLGPDGTHWEAAGEPTVRDNSVVFPVLPLGPAAEYTANYRVLSADGHPVSGQLKFTLTKAGTGTPAPTPAQAADAVAPAGDGGGVPIWVWIAGAALLLGGGVFFALRGGGGGKEDAGR